MKKFASLFVAVLAVSGAAQAQAQTCRPIGESNWKEARIDHLQNGAQVLTHIRATGIYLVADLFCSFDGCIGYINGIQGEGRIVRTDGRIETLVIEGRGVLPPTAFFCEEAP